MSNTLLSWEKRIKFLVQALILSVAVNVGLIATFIYFSLEEKKGAISFEKTPVLKGTQDLSNQNVLEIYSQLPFKELVILLGNKESLEEGYKKRDLALASLVSFHFFNIEKALSTSFIQKRVLWFIHKEGQEKIDLTVFPGLLEEQFDAVIRYAQVEKFPYTTEGLFFELKQGSGSQDSSLRETFYLSSEFHTMMTLFTRGGLALPKEIVLMLLLEGDWENLCHITEEQMRVQDLSSLRLKNVIASYLKNRSLLAAKILLEWDSDFLLKKLDDVELIVFIDLFREKSESIDSFLKEVLLSPRSDAVYRKCAEKLYAFSSLPFPEIYDYKTVLSLFGVKKEKVEIKLLQPIEKASESQLPVQKKAIIYVVQEGDTLWKIARKYKVSVEKIKEKNDLKSHKLRVGQKIQVPC